MLFSKVSRIFAIETSKTGKRKYIVCHLGRFMHRYWRHCPPLPQSRHYYELIRESNPCRLYFDLEYHKLANLHLTNNDPNTNILLMQQFMIQQLILEIQVSPLDIILLDLDSSTDLKFSRHLIVYLPQRGIVPECHGVWVFCQAFCGDVGRGGCYRWDGSRIKCFETGIICDTRRELRSTNAQIF